MIACPNEMFQYLLIMAATVSLPPVEPLAESPSPALLPMKNAPITVAMKGWSCSRGVIPTVWVSIMREVMAKIATP